MASRSGGNGVVIALVAFVFLFVISASLAVLFYTQKAAEAEKAATAERTKRQFVSAAQEGDEFYTALVARSKGAGDGKVYAQFKQDHQWLVQTMAGDATLPLASVEQAVEAVGLDVGQSLLGEINNLRDQVKTNEDHIARLETAREQAQEAADRMSQQVQQNIQNNEDTFDQMRDRIGEVQGDYDQSLAATNAERDDLQARHDQAQTDHETAVRALDTEIDTLKAEIQKLNARIRSLLDKFERLESPKMEYEHDGRVVEVTPRDNTVFINLGKNDQLILGMRFEVYDEKTGVRLERETQQGVPEQAPGKATIEVVRFNDDGRSASCRVIRQSFGQPVVTGDLVSNIVYDKHRKFRFYVSGDFDFNGDGRATSAERARIKNLIEQWGGEVIAADEMPVDTDFLVMGRQPQFPQKPKDDANELEIQNYIEQRRKALEYLELVGQAQKISVPLLTQNRFMTLIGYYQR